MNYDNHFSTGTHYDAIECDHKLCPFCDECHTTGCHNYYQPCEYIATWIQKRVNSAYARWEDRIPVKVSLFVIIHEVLKEDLRIYQHQEAEHYKSLIEECIQKRHAKAQEQEG